MKKLLLLAIMIPGISIASPSRLCFTNETNNIGYIDIEAFKPLMPLLEKYIPPKATRCITVDFTSYNLGSIPYEVIVTHNQTQLVCDHLIYQPLINFETLNYEFINNSCQEKS